MHENLRRRLVDVTAANMRLMVSRAAMQTRGHLIAKAARESLGLTQRDMAGRLGVTNVYLCKIEREKYPLTVELAEKMLALVDDFAAA